MNGNNDWLNKWPERYRECLRKIADALDFTEIRSIRELSGASGAETHLVLPEGKHGRPNPLILKLGPAAQLKDEVARQRKAATYFLGVDPPLKVAECDGAMCIAVLRVEGEQAPTFKEYYRSTKSPSAIAKVIRNLFDETLRPRDLNVVKVQRCAFSLYQLIDPSRLTRELRTVGDGFPTLVDWWSAAGEHWKRRSYKCFAHGDLHSDNIIVSGGRAYVIDFGRTKDHHVYRDFAKLERDVRLCLLSYETPAEHCAALDSLDNALRKKEKPVESRLRKAYDAIRTLRKCAETMAEVEAKSRTKTKTKAQANAQAAHSRIDPGDLEYNIALLAHCMFAAADPRHGPDRERARRPALHAAHKLRERIESAIGEVPLDQSNSRSPVLARFAYTFLRLEQLPSGGWAKTLPDWMEAIWAGESGTITRDSSMRQRGGTDMTCYALCQFIDFASRLLKRRTLKSFYNQNQCCHRARNELAALIGEGGGVGVGRLTQAGRIEGVHLRHTAQAVIAFLRCGEAIGSEAGHRDDLERMIEYLLKFLPRWQEDASHSLGMLCALAKLHELVGSPLGKRQLRNHQCTRLHNKLSQVLPKVYRSPAKLGAYDFKPDGTQPSVPPHGFIPYSGFWRMQRSNLLMSLQSLISEDRTKLLPQMKLRRADREWFEEALCDEFRGFLDDVDTPYDSANPTKSLIRYHDPTDVDGTPTEPPRDWALSAELMGLLGTPAVERLLTRHSMDPKVIAEKRDALRRALLELVDGYHSHRPAFGFTHGVALSGCLALADLITLPESKLLKLDQALSTLVKHGITERGLYDLIDEHVVGGEATKGPEIDRRAMKDMLVSKLESGEHTPDKHLCTRDRWLERVENACARGTISFYDGSGGAEYAERYGNDPEAILIEFLDRLNRRNRYDGLRALDVGCGPGQYSELLANKGFTVVAFDASRRMCEMTRRRLGRRATVFRHDLYGDSTRLRKESFSLVFACAMMVHVPRRRAGDVLRRFHRVLLPDGILFVNYKIGDHSLISRDDRFFEYYRSHEVPARMLAEAGFRVEAVVLNSNRVNIYGDPKEIRWANFYCRKRMG